MLVKSNFIPSDIFDRFIQSDPILKDKPITVFNDYTPTLEELQINPYNVLILNEPNELFGLHNWAIVNQNVFSCIFTWSDRVLSSCSNSILFPFGMSSMWETPSLYNNIDPENKQLKIFFVCGPKDQIEGHKMRHKIYSQENKIKIPHEWIFSCPIEEKNKNFNECMFHVAVENVKQLNLFTEKVIDAFLTRTVPVYRGCINIGEYFDERGVIKFDNEEELIEVVNSLTEKDYWDRQQHIETNYQKAVEWSNYFGRLVEILKNIVELNNI